MKKMNCQDTRLYIDTLEFGEGHARLEAEAVAHLSECNDCRVVMQRVRLLRERMHSASVPAPPAGFERRVLERIRVSPVRRRRHRRLMSYAVAASFLLCTVLYVALTRDQKPAAELAQNAGKPTVTQPVTLVVNSERALSGVTMTLAIPDGLELEAHPGVKHLSWQTDLQVGVNVLKLPVISDDRGGVVVATLKYGNARRQYEIQIAPSSKSGMFVPASTYSKLATGTPALSRSLLDEVIRHG